MAAVAGMTGQLRVSTNVAANVTDWSAEISRKELETTPLNPSGTARTYIMGLQMGSGTANANFDMSDTLGQKALHDACLNGTSVTLNLDTAPSGSLRTYSGTAFITKIKATTKVDDIVSIAFDFRFTGAITFA